MYKILICDDETDIRNALNIYLSAQGYETVLCANGQEALDAVEQGDIGLVLLDIMMPVMDGITVLSKLRKTSNCAGNSSDRQGRGYRQGAGPGRGRR